MTPSASHGAGTSRRRMRTRLTAARSLAARGRATAQQPQHAPEQVHQRRVGQRHRRVDVGVVEERQRHRERQQHEQVQMQQLQRPARVDEREQEQQAQRQPDVQRVDVPAERARIAARHRPGDLEPGPLFEHSPGGVGDDHLPDLLGAAPGEEAHLPAQRALQVGAAVGAGVFGPDGLHLRQRVRDRQDPVGRQLAPGRRDFRVGDRDGRFGDRGLGAGRGASVARSSRRRPRQWSDWWSAATRAHSCSPRPKMGRQGRGRIGRRRGEPMSAPAESNGGCGAVQPGCWCRSAR